VSYLSKLGVGGDHLPLAIGVFVEIMGNSILQVNKLVSFLLLYIAKGNQIFYTFDSVADSIANDIRTCS
jgi:hypothetical protein